MSAPTSDRIQRSPPAGVTDGNAAARRRRPTRETTKAAEIERLNARLLARLAEAATPLPDTKPAAGTVRRSARREPAGGPLLNLQLADMADRAMPLGRGVLLLKIAVDNLSAIEAAWGESAGRRLLDQLGERIRLQVRIEDTVVRLKDDSFAILCVGARLGLPVEPFCDRILTAASEPFTEAGSTWHVTLSIGAVLMPRAGADAADIVATQRRRLDAARKRGGNSAVRYAFDMAPADDGGRRLAAALRESIEAGTLDIAFQPKVRAADGKPVGLEALARWQYPEGSSCPPDVFIPIAEKTGLIHELGLLVLREACRAARPWLIDGLVDHVAVNLSPRQLDDGHTIDHILGLLAQERFEPRWLELEITESCLFGSLADAARVLAVAHKAGCSIVLDDFATGYANLDVLKRLPLDGLKIDRSFVDKVVDNESDRLVVSSMVGLAHAFALTIVAEGVETADQARVLTALGCDVLQGYHFAHPLSATDCEAWLRGRRGSPAGHA